MLLSSLHITRDLRGVGIVGEDIQVATGEVEGDILKDRAADDVCGGARERVEAERCESVPRTHCAVIVVAGDSVGLGCEGVIHHHACVLLREVRAASNVELEGCKNIRLVSSPVVGIRKCSEVVIRREREEVIQLRDIVARLEEAHKPWEIVGNIPAPLGLKIVQGAQVRRQQR